MHGWASKKEAEKFFIQPLHRRGEVGRPSPFTCLVFLVAVAVVLEREGEDEVVVLVEVRRRVRRRRRRIVVKPSVPARPVLPCIRHLPIMS